MSKHASAGMMLAIAAACRLVQENTATAAEIAQREEEEAAERLRAKQAVRNALSRRVGLPTQLASCQLQSRENNSICASPCVWGSQYHLLAVSSNHRNSSIYASTYVSDVLHEMHSIIQPIRQCQMLHDLARTLSKCPCRDRLKRMWPANTLLLAAQAVQDETAPHEIL